VKYFGVGNENWGCGGNMTPEHYANLYKTYQTYVRSYSDNAIVKVACGPSSDDYHWLETVLRDAGRYMDAIGVHHYVRGSGDWGEGEKGSATDFDKREWFALMRNTLTIYPLLERCKELLDQYDREGRIALFVDEWGTWWDAEPGTNPTFLYQQNTIRDAVSAGIFLNAFNENCDRVKMGNIAQINNVLQAMIFTKGAQMIVTPTYHVFEMYKVHQGATLLPSDMTCKGYGPGGRQLASLVASASKDRSGTIHVTICNLDPENGTQLTCRLDDGESGRVYGRGQLSGRVLTANAMNAHNTFDHPETVKPAALQGLKAEDGRITIPMPARSVVVVTIE
jgi:alpha-N-arabinofuranosidase